jgi:Phosphotransferase enzyme family
VSVTRKQQIRDADPLQLRSAFVSEAVPTDPRLPWVQRDWLAAAAEWIRERLAEHGLEPAGGLEQPHVRWWSTVLHVPTSEGDLWFKANAPPHAFEAALVMLLGRLRPEQVAELVAADPERGWLLMRDGGSRLRELVRSPADLRRWEDVLPAYAELQLAAASHVEELLGAGVPDERLAVLPGLLERVLGDDEALLLGRPGGVSGEEREGLRALLPGYASACSRLAAYAVPETIQHDDFHDGNVFLRDGRYRFLDWGDSCVSHPFHSLVVTLRQIAHRLELPPGGPDLLRLRDAYLEPFARYGSPEELAAAADLAHFTGTAARALAWHRFVSAREPEFRGEDAEALPYGLRRLLDLGPLGSWGEPASPPRPSGAGAAVIAADDFRV